MRTIAFLSFSVLSLAAPLTIKVAAPAEITRLDECIQTRFLASNVFGLNRIGPIHELMTHRMRVFTPENPIEQAVVDQLREKRFEVAVYLVGRGALEALPVPTPRGGLQGPASVTLLADTRLPDADAIFSEGKTALANIGRGPGSDVKEWANGGWRCARSARAIRLVFNATPRSARRRNSAMPSAL